MIMAAVEFEKEIRRAVDTGKVSFGYRNAEKSALLGKGKLLVVSANTPAKNRERLAYLAGVSGLQLFEFGKSALKLGSICGKPFPVTAMVVLEQGKSKVLSIAKKTVKGNEAGK